MYTLCDHSPGGVLLAEDLSHIMCAVPRFTLSVISSHIPILNEWNTLSADCVHSSSVNMFKSRIDKYLVRACMWTLDKPTASILNRLCISHAY